MPRLFFTGVIGDIQRLQVRYSSERKVPKERGKVKIWKAQPSPPKQSVKFKCKIWSKITKKFVKNCLDASSLWLSRKISAKMSLAASSLHYITDRVAKT